jgi:cytochrome c-type biogenesis protein CcmF
MSRASTVSTQQTQQSLSALFAERDAAISALVSRFTTHPWSVNFLLIVSPLVTWIWLGALIIAFGGLIALWPVPAFARRRAVARAGAARRGSPAVAARETA